MPAAAGTVSAKEAQKQLEELQPKPVPAAEAPKSAAPGTHPLRPVEDDAEALAQYQGVSGRKDPEDGLWHRTAYGGTVFVPGDRMPAAKPARQE